METKPPEPIVDGVQYFLLQQACIFVREWQDIDENKRTEKKRIPVKKARAKEIEKT
jgi:hypothetical protein